jgi:hypothetical protein
MTSDPTIVMKYQERLFPGDISIPSYLPKASTCKSVFDETDQLNIRHFGLTRRASMSSLLMRISDFIFIVPRVYQAGIERFRSPKPFSMDRTRR